MIYAEQCEHCCEQREYGDWTPDVFVWPWILGNHICTCVCASGDWDLIFGVFYLCGFNVDDVTLTKGCVKVAKDIFMRTEKE